MITNIENWAANPRQSDSKWVKLTVNFKSYCPMQWRFTFFSHDTVISFTCNWFSIFESASCEQQSALSFVCSIVLQTNWNFILFHYLKSFCLWWFGPTRWSICTRHCNPVWPDSAAFWYLPDLFMKYLPVN